MEKWNKIIDLKSDAVSSEVINDRILSDMTIGGANLIILVTAIIIACVGLVRQLLSGLCLYHL